MQKSAQFSLRSMLIATTVLALLCASLVLFGSEVLAFVVWIFELAVMSAFGTIAIYSRGYRRTFWAAALFGAAATLYFGIPRYAALTLTQMLIRPLLGFAAAAVSGTVAILTRRFVERRGWHRP
jgi:hypothetical protein